MQKKTLYLHIGWSKTGTSAIQYHLNERFAQLKDKGILYSKEMQMNDQAHHHFALAFAPIYGYPSKFTGKEAIERIDNEMESEQCESVLISSELSPFYYNNKFFAEWVKEFKEVKVLATIRRQSDVILSLFNQLVKDPNVRYKGSLLQLVLSSLGKFNYFSQLTKWENQVGIANVSLFNYDGDIVRDFLNYFDFDAKDVVTEAVVNPSFPSEGLLLLQERTKHINDAQEYRKVKESVLGSIANNNEAKQRVVMTLGEAKSINNHYSASNLKLCDKYGLDKPLFNEESLKDIKAY